ncbi:lanthionine synthetase C family protein [Streptomyces sp. NPDC050610]|uniref:lanthionine synthetase C family protein n=1 Tax=Streptomyces sp. NPDC050610 TaxID=3157097 RepID=UPI00342D69C4
MSSPSAPDAVTRETEREARSQSLSQGAIGTVLLRIERAHQGTDSWATVHGQLAAIVRSDLIASDEAALFYGAPAVAFTLHAAVADTGRYAGALHTLDSAIHALTRRRLDKAHARIDRGERPRAGEYDVLYGLAGLGSYLLRRDPHSDVLREVLAYLVRLSEPLPNDDEQLPGWWSPHGPTADSMHSFPGGHGNAGMAHGIAGPLALLALTKLRGSTVDGHTEAMGRICTWFDTLRQDTDFGPWWPRWITRTEHHTRTITQPGPTRPSWCYGTPGMARAQQLTGLALHDINRQHMAETALLRCLSDPHQLALVNDTTLCHGTAGLLHTTSCVARDAEPGTFTTHLRHLRSLLLHQEPARDEGLLEGTTGAELALHAADTGGTPVSGWDACLLLN